MSRERESVVKNKRPKSRCCSCCLIALIVVVVIVAGTIGVGYYFGNKFTKENFNLSLMDTLSTLNGVRTVDEKNLDFKEFDDDDYEQVEVAIKRQLYLKESTVIDYAGIYEALTTSSTTAEATSSEIKEMRNSLIYTAIRSHTILNAEQEESASNDALTSIITSIITEENMDLERLALYPDDFDPTLDLSDTELASFINKVMIDGAKKLMVDSDIKVGGLSLADIMTKISIHEIALGGKTDEPTFKFSIGIGAKEIATDIINEMLAGDETASSMSGVVSGIIGFILPETLYVTIDLNLGETASGDVIINGMDEQKMSNLYSIINGVMVMSGSDVKVESMVDDFIADSVTPIADTVKGYGGFDKVSEGVMSFDILNIAIASAGINDGKDEEDYLTGGDIIKTFKYVCTSSAELDTGATYQDQYKNAQGKVVYFAGGNGVEDGFTKVEYTDEFLKELVSKLILSDSVTLDTIAMLLGLTDGEGASTNFAEYIDNTKIMELAETGEDGLVITDRMIGSIFNMFFSLFTAGDETLLAVNPTVGYIKFDTEVSQNDVTHEILHVALTIEPLGFFEGNDLVSQIVGAVLPSTIMVTLGVDVTASDSLLYYDDLAGEFVAEELLVGEIKYNNLTQDETNFLLDLVGSFADGFSKDALLEMISPTISSAFDSMRAVLPNISFKETDKEDYTETAMETGGLFGIMAMQLNTMSSNQADHIDSSDIMDTIKGLGISSDEYEKESVINTLVYNKASDNYNGFMADIKSKYYIKDDANSITDFDSLMQVVASGSFELDNFNVNNGASSIIYDTRSMANLKPFFKDSELGSMFGEFISGETLGFSGDNLTVEQVSITPKNGVASDGMTVSSSATLSVVVKVDASAIMGGESDYLNILPFSDIYFTMALDIDKATAGQSGSYNVEFKINDMLDSEVDSMFKLLSLVNGGASPIDLDEIGEQIGTQVYDKLADIEESMGGNLEFVTLDSGESGMLYVSFYEFLASTSESVSNSETLKNAIQSMFPKNAEYPNDKNYSVDNIVTNRVVAGYDIMVDGFVNIADYYFGGILAEANFGNSNASLVQFISEKDGDNAILTFTFALTTTADDIGTDLGDLLASEIYFTFTLTESGGVLSYVENSYIVNEMTDDEKSAIIDFINFDTSLIEDIITQCVGVMDGYSGIAYGDGFVSLATGI